MGINVLYSGTFAAATEGALHEIPSVAVSLEYDEHPRFDRGAEIAVGVIEQLLSRDAFRNQKLYNLNIPTSATRGASSLRVVPMGVARWPAELEERRDPKGRRYYWASGTPPITFPQETDLTAIHEGHVTLTPLSVDRTQTAQVEEMKSWGLALR